MHYVLCYYCKERFDRDKEETVQVTARRYAHAKCAANKEEIQSEEERDKEQLFAYINKLFNTKFVDPKIQKQIEMYIKKYNFTYSGMLKALIYFYEIKKNSIQDANGGLGIIPYIYQEAFNYYYSLWEASQRNQGKKLEDYIPKKVTVYIPPPERRVKKRNLFSFLDEEVLN